MSDSLGILARMSKIKSSLCVMTTILPHCVAVTTLPFIWSTTFSKTAPGKNENCKNAEKDGSLDRERNAFAGPDWIHLRCTTHTHTHSPWLKEYPPDPRTSSASSFLQMRRLCLFFPWLLCCKCSRRFNSRREKVLIAWLCLFIR